MDDIKDIQHKQFSKFLDETVRTDPFGENKMVDRAYRRAERLAAAIFLLTNHVDPSEYVRQEARKRSVALMEQVMNLRDEMRSTVSPNMHAFQAHVRGLISLVRMLVFGGFVSSQNAEAVLAALDELGSFVHAAQRTALAEPVAFTKDDLVHVPESSKGHIRDIKDTKTVKDAQPLKDSASTLTDTVSIGRSIMTARASSILEILRSGGEMNIKDVAVHLPEYGEKTLQRELSLLVEKGLVRRNGLRRWSRYAVAQ
jgi:hypothetical protein